MKDNIILIGYMGTGKTSISLELNKLLHMECIDTDALIVEKENRSIADIFSKDGEAYFRALETDILKSLSNKKNLIISCGGGIVVTKENILLLKQLGYVFLLTATAQTVYKRISENKDRPLLNNNMNIEYIENMMKKRQEQYLLAADIIIQTDEKYPKAIAQEIANLKY